MIGRAVLRVWLLLALLLGGAGAANAQSYFNFSYTANGVSVMGTFVTTSQNNGSYLINSILNGMRGGSAITLLAPGGYQGNDNILIFPANPTYFNFNGFSYGSNNFNYNFYYDGEYIEVNNSPFSDAIGITDLMIAAVPAPLPGGGLLSFLALGLAGFAYRRRTILAYARALLAGSGLRAAPRPA